MGAGFQACRPVSRAGINGTPSARTLRGGGIAGRDDPARHSAAAAAHGALRMNKAEFVAAVADAAELSRTEAANAVDAMVSVITKTLKKGDTVTLVGFGTFQVRKRAARQGRNPKTGETIKIKASKNPSFKAGKALKDAVN
ncbi:HU family DNA-binding protein [Lysobacter humi (ex Lee et al. 2017)]